MFNKLLIANRGEISCRIIKTAKRLGIKTVALYSDADAKALHVNMADEAVHIGAAPSKDSYLRGDKIIQLAKSLKVDAIHPGYGFLSENADFARLCAENEIVFVGPPTGAIEAMGSKSAAKNIMQEAGVPLVPGYHGDDQTPDLLKREADSMGYPVLLKAAAGGGGKGMRQVWSSDEFDDALAAAKREALAGFADDHMLIEKYLTQPRHVEIQVFCDNHGNGVYLFERDCSVQRRHQKVIEEAPAPGMSDELRAQMGEAALKAAKAIHYAGAGTVEFLLDSDGSFYFMEMNTRLQVEHPVTEMITGEDLVEWQLKVANNEVLPKTQQQLTLNGHAFEARVYAEDPDNDFLPATGTLSLLKPPEESDFVRVDTGVVQGDEVSVYYDPMIAKLIVWDENRDKALNRLRQALTDYHIQGVTTNIDFLYNLAASEPFKRAELSTNFIEAHEQSLFQHKQADIEAALPLAALALVLTQQQPVVSANQDRHSPWQQANQWRANEQHQRRLQLAIEEEQFELRLSQQAQQWFIETPNGQYQCEGKLEGDYLIATVNGHLSRTPLTVENNNLHLFTQQQALYIQHVKPDLGIDDVADHNAGFAAPMNGTVVALLVEPGNLVEKDQPLVIMEAMKMEHSIKAPCAGKVIEFFCAAGELVDGGAELLAFDEEQ